MSDNYEHQARTLIDRWRDEWHLEPEPEMDGSNSKVYESLVDHVATALRVPRSPVSAAPVVDEWKTMRDALVKIFDYCGSDIQAILRHATGN